MSKIIDYCTEWNNDNGKKFGLYLIPEFSDDILLRINIRFCRSRYRQDRNEESLKILKYFISNSGPAKYFTALESDVDAYENGIVTIAINTFNRGYKEDRIIIMLNNLTQRAFPSLEA